MNNKHISFWINILTILLYNKKKLGPENTLAIKKKGFTSVLIFSFLKLDAHQN
jgi:hypothetical protein